MREFLHKDVIKNEIRRYFKNKAERDIDTVDVVDTNAELQKIFDEAFGDDVAPVKHGCNMSHMHPVDEFVCSVCGFSCTDYNQIKYDEDGDYTYFCECEFKYCPNCGAKMDGDGNA